MINFRFHVVSLIAIFLALALGVVIGAGVIDRGVVDALDNRLNTVEAKSERIKDDNDRLSGENDQLRGVIDDLQPFAVSGRLVGDEVGVVAVRGVDGDRTNAVVTAARQADATATGTLWLEDKWALASADDVEALQTALGSTTKNKNALRAEGWRQLAERLSAPALEGDGGASSDVLTVLQDAGFLGFDGVEGSSITDFPGRGAGIVLVVGTEGVGAVRPGRDPDGDRAAGLRRAHRRRRRLGRRHRRSRPGGGAAAAARQPAHHHGVERRRPRPARGPDHRRPRDVRPLPHSARGRQVRLRAGGPTPPGSGQRCDPRVGRRARASARGGGTRRGHCRSHRAGCDRGCGHAPQRPGPADLASFGGVGRRRRRGTRPTWMPCSSARRSGR